MFFFFQEIQAKKTFFTIFQNEKRPLQGIKTRSSKSRKIEIFPKGLTHGFEQKMAIFPSFFFQAIQARKMCFTIFQDKKNAFLGYKTTSSKSRKIEIFPKGLTHGFGQKMAIFPCFFLQEIQVKKMCFMIFQNEKTPLKPIKVRSLKSREIEIFPKGITHDFGQKMAIFPCFFYKKYTPRKCVVRYSRTEKRVSTL